MKKKKQKNLSIKFINAGGITLAISFIVLCYGVIIWLIIDIVKKGAWLLSITIIAILIGVTLLIIGELLKGLMG